MAWTIEFERAASRDLARLDTRVAGRIRLFLAERLSVEANPRSVGQPLKGSAFEGLWRYRVGDHRIIARIEDRTVTILVVRIGHRREVYRP